MRVAAIYDIHGNLPALEAVLDEIRRHGVDLVLVGGDLVPGPMPPQVLDLLFSLDIPTQFIRGNCEVAVLDHVGNRSRRPLPAEALEAIAWTADQLSASDISAFASWPRTLRLQIGGVGDVLFCHATPRDEDECFTCRTPSALLLPIFEGLGVTTVVCGHTHMQFDRDVAGVRIVNAGSVGMPSGTAGADWLLLDNGVHLQHTGYDLASAAKRVGETAYPQAAAFAERHILMPPSADEMLAIFAKADERLSQWGIDPPLANEVEPPPNDRLPPSPRDDDA